MPTLFSKIINGEIPCHKIAEDENHFAFLDINPNTEGHTLVVPKKETDYFFDLTDEEIEAVMAFSKKIAKAIDETLNPLRTGVVIQGLEVPHAHVHLIPLFTASQSMELSHTVEVSDKRMEELTGLISQAVQL